MYWYRKKKSHLLYMILRLKDFLRYWKFYFTAKTYFWAGLLLIWLIIKIIKIISNQVSIKNNLHDQLFDYWYYIIVKIIIW